MDFFISDCHIGHNNVISLDNRPFDSMQTMVNTMIENWNKVVQKRDTVYILGDFIMDKKYLPVLDEMAGHKYLIRGNHELKHDKIVQYFEEIVNYKELNTNHSKIILSHYPIAHWNGQYRGIVHLYGHIHNNTKDSQMMLAYKKISLSMGVPHNAYNVGCMMPYMDYTPQTLEDIISKGEIYYNQMIAEKTIQELLEGSDFILY